MDAYRSALAEAPQAADYRPSWATRIAAGLGGISAGMKDAGEGVKVAYATNRMPYTTALSDYKARIDPLEAAAKIESSDSDDMMKYMYQARTLQNQHESNVRQHQNDLMDYQVAVGGLNENRRWHDATIGQGDKRLGMERDNYLSLDSYRKGGLANQRFSNQTAREGMLNTNANALDANINSARANDIRSWAAHNPHVTPPTAGGLSTAEQDVLAEMHQTHPGFVVADPQDPSKYAISPPPDVTSPEYTQWKANRDEMLGRVNRRAHGTADMGIGSGGSSNRYDVTPAGEEEP
jgi:hypothetical protein